jgi:hypothetical protein
MEIFYTISEANKAPISVISDMSINVFRYKDLTKPEVLKTCWYSLQQALTEEDTVHIIAASVSDETMKWLHSVAKSKLLVKNIPTIDEDTPPYGKHPYAQYCEVRVNHFIPQYEYFIPHLEADPNKLYYFCNDDYLHLPESIGRIKKFYEESNFNGFFVPYDYPDNYKPETSWTRLHLSNSGYLRTVKSATPTFIGRGSTWLHFKYEMLRASVFADDSWTWRAFGLVPALAPLPGWTTHLQQGLDSPYIDWYSIAKEYLKRIDN